MRFACTVSRPADQNLTRQGLQAGNFNCPGDGGKAWPFNEMNGWRNQNLNRLYCAVASKGAAAWQGLWSWGKHKSGRGGGRGRCSRGFTKRRWRTGARRCSASMRTHGSVRVQTHSRTDSLMAVDVGTRGEVARSHAAPLAELQRRVSPRKATQGGTGFTTAEISVCFGKKVPHPVTRLLEKGASAVGITNVIRHSYHAHSQAHCLPLLVWS